MNPLYSQLTDAQLTSLLHTLNRATSRMFYAANSCGGYDMVTELATITEEVNATVKTRRFVEIANEV